MTAGHVQIRVPRVDYADQRAEDWSVTAIMSAASEGPAGLAHATSLLRPTKDFLGSAMDLECRSRHPSCPNPPGFSVKWQVPPDLIRWQLDHIRGFNGVSPVECKFTAETIVLGGGEGAVEHGLHYVPLYFQ